MKKEDYKKLVLQHYREQAQKHGLSLQSTMSDLYTREAEIKNLLSYLQEGDKCLEVGCGNGSASVEISKRLKLDLRCIDFSTDLVNLAKKQNIQKIKGKISFQKADVLRFSSKDKFDIVFTERCIINLLSWNDQQRSLKNMAGVLKSGGRLVLLEAFEDGLKELNNSRKEVGLEPVLPAYHNLHLNKEKVIKYLGRVDMNLVEENNFLSTYYFGSRVIYPALARANKQDVIYNSSFVNFFKPIPNQGNYSHIKIMIFKKS